VEPILAYATATLAEVEGDRIGRSFALVCQLGVSLPQELHERPKTSDDLK